MGTYSNTCCNVLDTLFRAQKRAAGPVTGRTRSKTKSRSARRSTTKSSAANSKPYKIEAGIHRRKAISKREQVSASERLCKKRLELETYLEGDEFRDHYGYTRFSIYRRIRQFTPLSPTGALGTIPKPLPTKVESPERLEAARKRKLAGRTSLSTVERMMTDEEMDMEWSLLPGEAHENELDFGLELEVMDYETVDGQTLEALYEGKFVEGVWRELAVQRQEDGEIVAAWASSQEAWSGKAREGAVMDVHCVKIVNSVWGRV
ncbi:uncharacterized protein K460DRAFT_392659 [Cucurbitaria berberidis CBS 394.84]|uniref:Uncharacterized protein n=1 Tax=Cucurbitaria berberidis CBS 394.84 TaxID=1168544 RepID=A0A9P4GL61_9PLEO|nr:uncharacterized protein K460DRAFT_392659 [Cucurbitaria berberidis CBS 394.84]KAF1847257.1 hypothetical protein K460DRAFT_392659 [Cucurbitaria berberidis CBS 394.84]